MSVRDFCKNVSKKICYATAALFVSNSSPRQINLLWISRKMGESTKYLEKPTVNLYKTKICSRFPS